VPVDNHGIAYEVPLAAPTTASYGVRSRMAGRRELLNTGRPGDGGIVLFLSPGHSSPTEVCWARDLSTG
jgi:hypothetical protein